MTQRVKFPLCCAASLVLLTLFALAPLMGAQQPPVPGNARAGLESGLPPSLLKNGPLGELLAIYTPRNSEEIQRLLGAARSAREAAENDIAESRRLVDVADGQVRIMNDEVKTTQTRLSVAKKEKDSSDRTSLNVELNRQKAELKYIERVRDSKKSDAAWLDGKSNALSARLKALELESDVARMFENIVVTGPESTPVIAGYRDALKQMLTARGEAADREADAAAMEKTVASRWLKQLDALSKLTN